VCVELRAVLVVQEAVRLPRGPRQAPLLDFGFISGHDPDCRKVFKKFRIFFTWTQFYDFVIYDYNVSVVGSGLESFFSKYVKGKKIVFKKDV
jgi:hypothetical protein